MGSYVNSNLISGERAVFETKYHWIIFFTLSSLLTLGIYPLFLRWVDEFVITNKRVVIKLGFISRKTLELNLSKVESVGVNQSILGRLLGYGTIVIIGTGGTRESFRRIAQPLQFRKKFQEYC